MATATETYEIVTAECGDHCENLRLYGDHKASCEWTAELGAANDFATISEAAAALEQLRDDLGWEHLRIRVTGERYPL